MKDQLISFETAKLAKEKEFTWDNGMVEIDKRMFPNLPNKIKRLPTQSLLQKWLREEYHIIVESQFVAGKTTKTAWYDYIIHVSDEYARKDFNYSSINLEMKYKTYEEALEIGLQEALKLL